MLNVVMGRAKSKSIVYVDILGILNPYDGNGLTQSGAIQLEPKWWDQQ